MRPPHGKAQRRRMLTQHAPQPQNGWPARFYSTFSREFFQIEDWSNEECYKFTGFTQDKLYEIYGHFGLEEVAEAEPHIGYIAICSNSNNDKYHLFPPEEIFLFFMTRMRTGDDRVKLCTNIFGGHATRWSPALNWMMKYLDDRYERTISHRKLEDYADDFPRFYNAISGFMKKDSVQFYLEGDRVDRDGLNFCPFPIFGFIDCSIDKICRPFSGPDGDYIGAARKLFEDIYQRSVYTGYKKIHGIKVETVLLANGIMTIFGPASARVHDVGGILRMSQLDNFLVLIQQGKQHMYMAFGDGAYNSQDLNCQWLSIAASILFTFMNMFAVSDKILTRTLFYNRHSELFHSYRPRCGIDGQRGAVQPKNENCTPNHRALLW